MSTFLGPARTRIPRLLESAQERARLTVVPQRTPRVARVPFAILVLLLLAAGLVGLLVLNTSLQEGAFRAATLQTRQLALSKQQSDLELEIGALRNPQRLASRAARLGMVPNTNPAFIDAGSGAVKGVPLPAVPGTGPELRPPPPTKTPAATKRPARDNSGADNATRADTRPQNNAGKPSAGDNGRQTTPSPQRTPSARPDRAPTPRHTQR